MAFEKNSAAPSRLLSSIILGGDVLLLNLVLYVCRTLNSEILAADVNLVQLHVLCSFAYLMSSGPSSVILHYRKVKAYQIMGNVFRNVVFFTVITFLIFIASNRIDLFSIQYALFIGLLFLVLAVYRVSLRMFVKHFRREGKNQKHAVLVGSRYNIIQMYKELTNDKSSGFNVHGYFADEPSEAYPAECPYLGKPSEVTNWLHTHPAVQQLYCSLPSARESEILPIINYCENNLVHFYSLPNLYNYLHNRVYFNMMGPVPYLSLRKDPLALTENRFIKRVFDIVVSGLFLCTLFPIILLIVTIITKITMPGPVFFKQKRNGLNDKEFYCYKFRSMKVNKDADKVQATKNDPRKTKWGNIMRKTSIDELPQFINVFKGEMSVVGPRPHMVKHTEEYSKLIDKYMVRHFVKPGVTGWAQVTGFRGETKELKDMEGRIQADIWYIEHWNLWMDIYIMYKTVANAVHGEKNAY